MTEQTIEAQARAMDWVPKEEFKGDPEKWVDAETYVERGQQIMPILRANNRRLLGEVTDLKGQLSELATSNKELADTVKALKEQGEEMVREGTKRAIKRLLDDKKAALKENDTDAIVEIDEAIATLRAKETAPAATTTIKTNGDGTTQPVLQNQPWFKEWIAKSENAWFGKDKKKSGYAMGVAQELKDQGYSGAELLEKMGEEVNEHFGETTKRGDKMEGARGGSGNSSGTRGKSYADLPADAKRECDKWSARLVGEGRGKFKTVEEHRKSYVAQYFGAEQ